MKTILYTLGALVLIIGVALAYGIWQTKEEITAYRQSLQKLGALHPSPELDASLYEGLPPPVQRYFAFTFRNPPKKLHHVVVQYQGQFRLPTKEGFHPAKVEQWVCPGIPALVFDANVTMSPLWWAHAYDAFVDGEMEMKAKILSLVPGVHEKDSPELNAISLRRWLLESPLYPAALLPSRYVRWEAVNETQARAIVSFQGVEASLLGTFREDGSLATFQAEDDGDLNTPYHGSGEYSSREDYQEIEGIMLPMSFSIGRAAKGNIYPFWYGKVTSIVMD